MVFHAGLVLCFPRESEASRSVLFWPLKLIALELFRTFMSINLVPDDEFPTFLLVGRCTHLSRVQAYQLTESTPQTDVPVVLHRSGEEGPVHSPVGRGEPGAPSRVRPSRSFPIFPQVPPWTATGTWEEHLRPRGKQLPRDNTSETQLPIKRPLASLLRGWLLSRQPSCMYSKFIFKIFSCIIKHV